MESAKRLDFIEIPAVDGRNGACYAMPCGFPRGRTCLSLALRSELKLRLSLAADPADIAEPLISMRAKSSAVKVAYADGGSQGIVGFLIQPFYNALQYRELIRVVLGRELHQRFRASYFGWIWSVATPLLMLFVFVTVFSNTFKVESGPEMSFALSMFIGLLFFNLFAELVTRAPLLLSEHAHFIKKSIFPSEILAWTSLLRSLTYAGIGFVIFLIFELYIRGSIPLSALLFPLILIPLFLLLLGMVWLLSALGAFTRDIAFMIASIMPVVIFATPVFYTTLNAPLPERLLSYINPLAPFIEMGREVMLLGRMPDLVSYGVAWVIALFFFYAGYAFFMRFRSVVVDVI
jgi:lipopolysaccharide transport system permease protein